MRRIASLLLGASLAIAASAQEPWTRDRLIAWAQDHAPTLVTARTSLENAREKVANSWSFWQSSFGGSAQVASPSGTSTEPKVGLGVSSSWKPLDQVSLDVSYDDAQGLRASTNVRPFATSASAVATRQALEQEELRYAASVQSFTKTFLTSYTQWVRASLALTIAEKDRELKQDSLDAEQIRYDSGKSSETVIGSARIALLDADKALWSQKVAEKQARDGLLLAAGYLEADFDQQVLAPPQPEAPDVLLSRAQGLLDAKTPPRADTSLTQARLKVSQAEQSAAVWPSLLSGVSASGSYAAKSGSWSASLGYNLSFSTLVDPQEATLAQNLKDARWSLAQAEIQARSNTQTALWSLQGAMSQLQLAVRQLVPAQAAVEAQTIRSTSGSSSAQKLQDLQINLLRAQVSVIAAQSDLEVQLLNWK